MFLHNLKFDRRAKHDYENGKKFVASRHIPGRHDGKKLAARNSSQF